MTTSLLRQRNSDRPSHHEVSLCIDYNPISARYNVTVTERATAQRSVTSFALDTDGIIALEELEECLAVLDTKAHLLLNGLLDVQLHLF